MSSLEYLNWDLAVLSKAVAYSNLSGASTHVGLSQPQLSRIIAKLEEQFDVSLLDRDAKRKSSWTPAAFRLAEVYSKTVRQFEGDINQLLEGAQVKHLRIASLEGLQSQALAFANHLAETSDLATVEIHIYDLSELEERFFRGELDAILTSREPGRKKYRFSKTLGYQTLNQITEPSTRNRSFKIYSPFQYTPSLQNRKNTEGECVIVSNSLYVRERWLASYGGSGTMPSKVHKKRSSTKNEEPVLLLLQDHFTPTFWKQIADFES